MDRIKRAEKYNQRKRKRDYDNGVPLRFIHFRQRIHYLLLLLIKVERKLSKERLKILFDKRKPASKPKVYACTHIGGNDVQRVFEAIREHAYLFIGDPKELYWDAMGAVLKANGAICFETYSKPDRKIAYKRAVELLREGGNLLIFPEGAWNITVDLPVMHLYLGAARMAIETDAEIIPVAIEQYGKMFVVNIGENIGTTKSDAEILTEILRDQLATLKWEIWESRGIFQRKKMDMLSPRKWAEKIVERCEYSFTVQDVLDTMFIPKGEEEVLWRRYT